MAVIFKKQNRTLFVPKLFSSAATRKNPAAKFIRNPSTWLHRPVIKLSKVSVHMWMPRKSFRWKPYESHMKAIWKPYESHMKAMVGFIWNMMKASNLRWPSRQEIWSDLSAAQTRHYATAAALLEGGTMSRWFDTSICISFDTSKTMMIV
jgi:hypothetical protein